MADSVIPTRHNARVGAPPPAGARGRGRGSRGQRTSTAPATPPSKPPKRVPSRRVRRAYGVFAAILGLAVLFALTGLRFERQPVGYIGVVRNGGPLDNRSVRQILLPGQRLTFTGWFSQKPHEYPSATALRTLAVTGDPRAGARTGTDVITVPTRDGVQVGLDGTLFFRFIGERDIALTSRFDVTIGSRRFPNAGGKELYPWQGEEGFAAAVSGLLGPNLENNLRREVGAFDCAQLVASCSIVHRARRGAGARVVGDTNTNLAAIQSTINRTLEYDAAQTLGRHYFFDMHFVLSRVTLPGNVQSAVDDAQAQYAGVSRARATAKQARYRAKALALLAHAYNSSPGLARVEALKAVPRGATVILSENGKSPSVITPAGGSSPLPTKPQPAQAEGP
jgi:SPFH domain / Band 7 family